MVHLLPGTRRPANLTTKVHLNTAAGEEQHERYHIALVGFEAHVVLQWKGLGPWQSARQTACGERAYGLATREPGRLWCELCLNIWTNNR